jgi:NADH-quinone oxidoreductase subunit C
VTESPSDARAAAVAERVAGLVSADRWSADHGTAIVAVSPDRWVEAHAAVKAGFPFFSWLSAIDWAQEVSVGDPPSAEEVEERYQVLSRLADVSAGEAVILTTDVPKSDATLPTLTGVYGGADWHEREAAEMFGIRFEGHPNLIKLYLPDGFEGHPLRKSFPLLSREVKPWPGDVNVEDMPSTENVEAGEDES